MPFYNEIEHCGLTDVGQKRSHNQDAFTVQEAPDREVWSRVGHLFIVADGMGGHAVGEMASAKAVQEIPLTYVKHVGDGPASALRHAFQEANAGIHAIGSSNPEFRGLGTTATAIALRQEGAWIAHVGDSRAYRVRGEQIQQLTYDHSYAWEMARRLGIPPEELGDIKKNVIVRSLGPDPLVQVDVEGPYPLEDGDTFILGSDGLTNLVLPPEIGAIIRVLPVDEAARFLIELANLRGGPDNITVLIVRVGAPRDAIATPGEGLLKVASRAVGKLFTGWGKRVPWPISVLMLGFLLAILFVVCTASDSKAWATFFFATAMIAIAFGVVGLFIHQRRQEPVVAIKAEVIPKASIHRQYSARIDATLVEQYLKTMLELKKKPEAREVKIDWPAYKSFADPGMKMLAEGDHFAAFRHLCRALVCLAVPFNKHHPKEESFRPKW